MNLTEENKEQKDLNTKRFEERLAEKKANGFKVIDSNSQTNEEIQDILKKSPSLKGLEDFDFEKIQQGWVSSILNTPPIPSMPESLFDTSFFDEQAEHIAKEKRKQEEYQQAVIRSLQGIEKNTAILTEMTTLLQKNGERQEEIFAIMIEIMEIMKSSNKEEAETKFAAVTRKITTFTENAGTVTSLIGMAQTVYNALPF